jgi:hypothetical protein
MNLMYMDIMCMNYLGPNNDYLRQLNCVSPDRVEYILQFVNDRD